MRQWQLRYKLAALTATIAFVAIATLGGVVAFRYRQATVARHNFERASNQWESHEATSPREAVAASDAWLRAELALPFADVKAAHTANLRRLAEMRMKAEGWYVGTNDVYFADWRDLEVVANSYSSGHRQLFASAGREYGRQLDSQYDFPLRKELGPQKEFFEKIVLSEIWPPREDAEPVEP